MLRLCCRLVLVVLTLLLGLSLVSAVPSPELTKTVIKDRKDFIPYRKYAPLPGKMIAVLVSDVAPMMNQEGRSGPPNAFGMSLNGNSYRWIYVPVAAEEKANSAIRNLPVRVGEKGEKTETFPELTMASPDSVKRWNIQEPYALVEVEVNHGAGAPAEEGFVATRMKRLDGTEKYPLKVAEVMKEVRKRHEALLKKQERLTENAMTEAGQKALGDKKATGPRDTKQICYVTWMAETQRLVVRFQTTITDGAIEVKEIGGPRARPIGFPPPPGRGVPRNGLAMFPPPPPPPLKVRTGTEFGIIFGYAFEITPEGKIDRELTLPYESFRRELGN